MFADRWRGDAAFRGGDQVATISSREFRLENQMPVWRYEVDGVVVEKFLVLLHGQKHGAHQLRLLSRPRYLAARTAAVPALSQTRTLRQRDARREYVFSAQGERYEVSAGEDLPVLRMVLRETARRSSTTAERSWKFFIKKEADRGYESRGILWSPGCFQVDFSAAKKMSRSLRQPNPGAICSRSLRRKRWIFISAAANG